MCGIAGFVGSSGAMRDALAAAINPMVASLAHRGPDGQGIWIDEGTGVALGHRRLAILDLSAQGAQPMRSADGRFTIAYNGEIYNHEELRRDLDALGAVPHWRGHSDTEVMLAAIAHWGLSSAITRFVGMFAFALWDARERALHLARDRLGEKPLYYGRMRKSLLFGSELKALRRHPEWRGTIDRRALALFIRHGYVPAPLSIYDGIRKVVPGTILTFASPAHEPVCHTYWSASKIAQRAQAEQFTGSDEDACEALDRLLRQATREQMVADVPVGAFLSGGIDSSCVTALMQAQNQNPVRTFTIGFEEREYNEAEYARRVATHLGTDHTELFVTARDALAVIPKLASIYDEPFADSSQIPTFLVSQLTRQHVTVSLSGDGGDELFGGYTRYLRALTIRRSLHRLPPAVRGALRRALMTTSTEALDLALAPLRMIAPARYKRRLTGNFLQQVASRTLVNDVDQLYLQLMSHWQNPLEVTLAEAEAATVLNDPSMRPQVDDFLSRMMVLDLLSYLPDDLLVKVDRASMAVGLESRAPFLDHRVVEFALRLPPSMKVRGREGKWLLRKLLDRYVPRPLVDRPKMGFAVPLAQWLRGPLRDWATGMLDPVRIAREGYFRPQTVAQYWGDHLLGVADHSARLWNLLVFQAWHEAQPVSQ